MITVLDLHRLTHLKGNISILYSPPPSPVHSFLWKPFLLVEAIPSNESRYF